jgi:LPS sulfotransferase NodH
MPALDAMRSGTNEVAPGDGSATGVDVRLSYLVCAMPRSGSYLLCEGLRNTGVAGWPTEYFSSGFQAYWSPRWGTPAFGNYLRRAVAEATTSNGVCGVKAHAPQFDYFARQASGRMPVPHHLRPGLLDLWFPNLHYVRLRRRDAVRQAVSYVKAIQSNIWWDADAPPAPYDAPRPDAVRFDYLLIEASLARLAEEDDRWTRYFATTGITPLTLDYEDISADPHGAVRAVLDFLEIAVPGEYVPSTPTFRRQANEQTEEWVERFNAMRTSAAPVAVGATPTARPDVRRVKEWVAPVIQAAAVPGRTDDATPVDRSSRVPIDPDGALRPVLGTTRWWKSAEPFPHVRAAPVFGPETYDALVGAFRAYEAEGRFTRGIPGYDVTAMPLTRENARPFDVFMSRPWHDLLARMFDVDATGELNISLHHHAVGSASGSPHNDLNPGWFVPGGNDGEVVVHSPRVCDYRTGASKTGEGTVERIRAVAVIYHLANPPVPSHGGETGLYRSAGDPVDQPLVLAPPVNNSLLAFECTPFSYHAFLTNHTNERNCLVMWLHRSREDVVDRFGEGSIVGW